MGRSTEDDWIALRHTAGRRRARPLGWLRLLLRVRWVRVLLVLVGLALLAEATRRFTLSQSLYRLNLGANAALAELPDPTPGDRVLIFAPHPDDEILGSGGFLQRALEVGAAVQVALLTNGEYSRISAALSEGTVPHTPAAFIRLGYARQEETLAALRGIGVPDRAVTFLGYPNEYLDQMWAADHWLLSSPVRAGRLAAVRTPYTNAFTPNALFAGQSLLADIQHLLLQFRPTIVITIHPNDSHSDHWPTYAFVQLALQRLRLAGQPFAREARLFTYLVHRDHWPAPRGFLPLHHLEPPVALTALDGAGWRAFPLTLAETLEKRDAINQFRSQGAPHDKFLASFARANELLCLPTPTVWRAEGEGQHAQFDDPVVDTSMAALAPSGDIRTVSLSATGRRLVVGLETVGRVNSEVRYHLTLHSLNPGGDLQIVQCDWSGTRAAGVTLRGGVVRALSGQQVSAVNGGRVSELRTPLPWNETPPVLLVRAWTTKGNRILDQTAVALVTPAQPAAAPSSD